MSQKELPPRIITLKLEEYSNFSRYVTQKVQELTEFQSDLPSQAQEIIFEGKGLLEPAIYRILANELKLYSEGKENELGHFLMVAKKQMIRTAEIVEKKENRNQEELNFLTKHFSLQEIKEKLNQNKLELEKVTERWNTIEYPKGRTQRVATMVNRMNTLTHEIFLYEQILEDQPLTAEANSNIKKLSQKTNQKTIQKTLF